VLEVTDLTRTYGHGAAAHVTIEGVSLSVAEGELVSIVGPSGWPPRLPGGCRAAAG
jgi:NitT/TauT family transport system ATP-binding protein